MKRITFFVGNGFDINNGLKTRYTDFYDYYIQQNPDDKLAQNIGKDYKYWADLETGLGKYTEKIAAEEKDDFWKSAEALEKGLADYLELQMAGVEAFTEEQKKQIAQKTQKSLNEFYKEFPVEKQEYLLSYIRNTYDEIRYSFVSFNYTDTLDLCLKAAKEVFVKGFGDHIAANRSYYDNTLDGVIHMHGTTKKEMVMGVNDEGQIANREFAEDPTCCELLIKERTNQRFAQNKIQKVRDMIEQSMIICIFGMSIGETDRMWWQAICEWLTRDTRRRLIVYVKHDIGENKRVTKYDLFSTENDVFNKLKMNANVNIEQWNKIKEQIYVNFNSSIFDFDGLVKSE